MMKIKAKFKKCSVYPHRDDVDDRFDIIVEVDVIQLTGYGEKIHHMCGTGDDLETYYCWEHNDIEILEFSL